MLQHISWSVYFEFTGFFLAGYYLFIGFRYYANDIKLLLNRRQQGNDPEAGPAQGDDGPTDEENPFDHFTALPQKEAHEETDTLLQQADELAPRLKIAITTAGENGYVQEEFIQSLRTLLQQYKELNKPAFRVAINNLIASECEKNGSLHLSEEELSTLWLN